MSVNKKRSLNQFAEGAGSVVDRLMIGVLIWSKRKCKTSGFARNTMIVSKHRKQFPGNLLRVFRSENIFETARFDQIVRTIIVDC